MAADSTSYGFPSWTGLSGRGLIFVMGSPSLQVASIMPATPRLPLTETKE